ncbi:aconitase [Plasticicumulans lactativorans]|uniref:Aconitate hydratase n=1 Tax=Plasticicumulans lactativorans TaxID=1133106 RepID=A0A4R2LK28_9GAMM|nr:aconitate hydratase AcnA [Plasticicumulans lactativorans]TCO79735.1 aconitase [Plasticicumulans lactativorans]
MLDSFQARATLSVNGRDHTLHRLAALAPHAAVERLPYALKILLENLLRCEDGVDVRADDILALARWQPGAVAEREIAFTPARVLMQDFTGVPAVVDLAAMREAMAALGGDPARINPLAPAELVIDHSVMVDHFAAADALERNAELEFARNRERYAFLRWGQQAFDRFRVVPPRTGICHQVNLEYLARVVFTDARDGLHVYPDTLVGTDSHTTMINALGVLGWGVGGIEAEAAMLGQPITMLIPEVVGMRLRGRLREGVTATDLVLTVTQRLRAHGVVGKFVEFFGPGLAGLPLADRATIANMAPEYGATCGLFPIDAETLAYLRLSGRDAAQVALVEAYARAQGLFAEPGAPEPLYSQVLDLDLDAVEPSLAGPRRPQDRIALAAARPAVEQALAQAAAARGAGQPGRVEVADGGYTLADGAVVIAAITSCTNTSNPGVILGAGLLAQKALARGLRVRPWVKTSLAPGSQVVTAYLEASGLLAALEGLGFALVGYGCTTCIGNSGPLPGPVSAAIRQGDLAVGAVLSGNRNFEGRIHPEVKLNFLASPPLVVAYALAGTLAIDLTREPLGLDGDGRPVLLKDIWPSAEEIARAGSVISQAMFRERYADVFAGDAHWRAIATPAAGRYAWDAQSTYIRHPPYFEGMTREPPGFAPIADARVLLRLGDSITTDHISPAGSIKRDGPAGRYLVAHGVAPADFNSYGARRGNHEVMVRGTFANVRLRNELVPGTEGGVTRHQPSGETLSVYDAAMRYAAEGVPLVVLAGKEYGTGSSRDWAAKGTRLLGVRAVIAESYERIHRSNLVGMGVLPLEFPAGASRDTLGLSGSERYAIEGLVPGARSVTVVVRPDAGQERRFPARVRIDTPKEWAYFEHGGILPYVLRQLAG